MGHTILCVYYTILCMPRLLFALFNFRPYCHIDIEKGLATAWTNPFYFNSVGIFTPVSSP